MKITQTGFSAYHIYLNLALNEAIDEYERTYAEIQNYPQLTKESPPEVIRLHYRLEQKYATAILLTACCVEAISNLLLAMKTTPDQFATLQRASFIEKWTVAPSLFMPGYTLPRDGELYQDLKRLQNRRNALAHLKEEVVRDEVVVHPGSLPEIAGDEHIFLGRCRTLPLRLVKHVTEFDKSAQHLLRTLSFKFPDMSHLEGQPNKVVALDRGPVAVRKKRERTRLGRGG
jgi:hypothetical protein